MRLRSFLTNVGLLAASTAVAVGLVLGIGELWFRVRAGAAPAATSWLAFHPERGWAPAPGEYVNLDHSDLSRTRISINAEGLRNPPLAMTVPAGRRRVSILGDSFVFGAALDESQTIPGHLRTLLGDGHEVVNLGVEGYGTGTEYLLLEELAGRGFEPGEAIVLVFFTNDILDNLGLEYGTGTPVPHMPRFWVDSSGALRHTRPENRSIDWARTLEKRWMFLRYLRSRASNLVLANAWMLDLAGALGMRPDLPRTPAVVEGFYSAGWEERWRSTGQILTCLAGLARRLGTPLYIVFVPSPFQVVETLSKMAERRAPGDSVFAAFLADADRPQRCLRDFCDRNGLPFLDATPLLRSAARVRPPYLIEAHLSPYGAGIVAAAIRDEIRGTARR
jgi:hypothetical protein